MIDPLLGLAFATGFSLLLASAAWHKAASPASFAEALREYRLLPVALVAPVAWLLPAAEAALAAAWLSGAGRAPAALATAALLFVYAAAIAINLRRGRTHIACGCGLSAGGSGDGRLSWWLVARNLVLAALAGVAALPVSGRGLAAYDWLTLAAATAAAVALFAGTSQLLRNGAAIASWRTSRD